MSKTLRELENKVIFELTSVELKVKLTVVAVYEAWPSGDVKNGAAAGSHVTDPLKVLDAAPPSTPEKSTVPEKSIVIARAGAAITRRRSTATSTGSFFIKALLTLIDLRF